VTGEEALHVLEARLRLEALESLEVQIALGQVQCSSKVHAHLARLAQQARRHLWVATEEAAA
jgi:hypothetical protein